MAPLLQVTKAHTRKPACWVLGFPNGRGSEVPRSARSCGLGFSSRTIHDAVRKGGVRNKNKITMIDDYNDDDDDDDNNDDDGEMEKVQIGLRPSTTKTTVNCTTFLAPSDSSCYLPTPCHDSISTGPANVSNLRLSPPPIVLLQPEPQE